MTHLYYPAFYSRGDYRDEDKAQYPALTLKELELLDLIGAVREKPQWARKVLDPTISAKWCTELADQSGACKQDLDYVFAELNWQALHQPLAAGPDNVAGIDDALAEDRRLRLMELVRTGLERGVEKDWHPRAKNQVLDLVHPSLFPLKYEHTRVVEETLAAQSVPESVARVGLDIGDTHYPSGDGYASTQFQWLPAEIAVSEDGTSAEWISYINNLHPETHAELYSVLAELFVACVPLLEMVLARITDPVQSRIHASAEIWYKCKEDPNKPNDPSDAPEKYTSIYEDESSDDDENDENEEGEEEEEDAYDRYRGKYAFHPYAPISFDPAVFELSATPNPEFALKGRQCQVITKLANIHLTPEDPEYAGGSWHIEGMENEQIVATALYYYDMDNVTESKLAFRARVRAPEYQQSDFFGIESIYGLNGGVGILAQPRGHITARAGRAVAFPNLYHHQVQRFRLADPTRPGHRKIVAFFLIDPELRIPSSARVAPQRADWLAHAVLRGPRDKERIVESTLPVEVVQRILLLTPHMMTMAEAKKDRLVLMDERTAMVEEVNTPDFLGAFNMCEH
ncbi:hypothetical protein BC828DRAFT_174884 [Blastocladiella britannica]|nr:hypothetical protein BC828DRAFT_174884 [Blastocladiella britannica]